LQNIKGFLINGKQVSGISSLLLPKEEEREKSRENPCQRILRILAGGRSNTTKREYYQHYQKHYLNEL